jgi:poly(3-hydroxyoctanoate) depolymerase
MTPAEIRFVRVEGLRVRVAVSGEGPPLLLIMGLLGNLRLWDPLREQLPGVQIISFDAPGVGGSDVPMLPMSMMALARWTDRLVAELGFAGVDVLGLSFGGALAQQLALAAPARVRRLVLAATSCGLGGVPGSPWALQRLFDPRVILSRRGLERASPSLFGGRAGRDPSQVMELPWGRPPSLRGYAWQLAAIGSWSSLPWLHRLRHETLILAGDDDPLVPLLNAQMLRACIPRAQLRVIRGGGHLFLLDSAEDVAPLIAAFLRRGTVRTLEPVPDADGREPAAGHADAGRPPDASSAAAS